jgi:hypothetical protein
VVQLTRRLYTPLIGKQADDPPRKRRTPGAPPPEERTEPLLPSADMRLVMRCPDSPRVYSVPISAGPIVVGRIEGNSRPTVDLAALQAADKGVSRYHCAFILRDNDLYIEDLHSTNGTRINGFPLVAGRAYLLRAGDEIELGQLTLTVTLLRVPPPRQT